MDINSKINWKPGMEITAETLKNLSAESALRDTALIRSVFGSRLGILPNAGFSCEGSFVKKKFEFRICGCMAILPSGRLIDVDEDGAIEIGSLEVGKHYLCVGFSGQSVEFEREGVPMTRPKYSYSVRSFSELEDSDELPLMRFTVLDGAISLDPDYIPPCMRLSVDARLSDAVASLVTALETLSSHPNLEEGGEVKRALLWSLFMARNIKKDARLDEFLQITSEIAQSVNYYVTTPNCASDTEPIPQASVYDVQLWLQWLEGYLKSAATVLDGIVLEDRSIDFDALKEQLRSEIYDALAPQVEEGVRLKYESLKSELEEKISDALKDYISGEFRRVLHDELDAELSASLEGKLYGSLYDALYAALFVPAPALEEYTPVI